jgi:hypothetical protein
MKLVKALALVMVLMGFVTLTAQEACMFWFSLSDTDPTQVTSLPASASTTFTLHAWASAYQPTWAWIDGVGFAIQFNTDYLEILDAQLDANTFANYMFKGVNWEGGPPPGPSNPGQVLWFGSICFSGCLQADGNPFHVGSVTFHVIADPPAGGVTVIDTMTYPPSNPPMMNDNTGLQMCSPTWMPFELTTGVAEKDVPTKFFLGEFRPNPFNNVTSISFGLPKRSNVRVEVYDVTGRLVRTLVSGVKEAGTYTVEWNGRDDFGRSVSSGAYFVRMISDEFNATKRLLLLR